VSDLANAVRRVASDLGDDHVAALSAAYRTASSYSATAVSAAKQAVPAPHHDELDRLHQAWSSDPAMPGSALALALESARLAVRRADVPRVEVVVTGPDSPAAPVRLTSEVVTQLIDRAMHRVTLVSYAAYQIPAVIAALDAAVARGVAVSLILESPEKLEGGGGAHAYKKFRMYHWPIDRRQPPEARLHAKAIIVDSSDVLLTSANMTLAAYDKNIELGVLCRGGGIAAQVQHHFDALISHGLLTSVG
jgi:phosphatidylserine/phosphatidylglycerophosphate/cardiolipin synthase-like enzyme